VAQSKIKSVGAGWVLLDYVTSHVILVGNCYLA